MKSASLLIQWVPGVRRPGRETDHSPPSSPMLRMHGRMPPLLPTPSWRGG